MAILKQVVFHYFLKEAVTIGMRGLLKTNEAAEYLSMSPWSLRRLVKQRKIAYVSLGDNTSTFRFNIKDLDGFIAKNTIQPKEKKHGWQ